MPTIKEFERKNYLEEYRAANANVEKQWPHRFNGRQCLAYQRHLQALGIHPHEGTCRV